MPFHTAPGLASKNKFIFNDDVSSEDEGLGNVDPSEMITKATAKAVKQAKADAKKQAVPVVAAPVQKEEAPKPKREPRANNQARKGPRKERGPKDGEAKDGENQVRDRKPRDGDDRRQRRPRNQDRQSGNPRTGRKAQEKKGGAGAGNWGKADENLEETAEAQLEKTTPEDAENAENGENAEAAAENAEPEEPKIQYLTLEEYEAAQAGDAGVETKKEAVRQSNDGQALKGRQLNQKQVYNTLQASSSKSAAVRENAKQHVAAEFVGFQSDYGSGRDRRGGDRRDNNRRNNNRGDQNNNRRNNNKGGMANIDDKNAFPALGAK